MATPATRAAAEQTAASSSKSQPTPVLIEEPGPRGLRRLDGKGLKIAIVSTRWYEREIVGPLVRACRDELLEKGVESADLTHLEVSGAFELPFVASRVLQTKKHHIDAVICIGCMVKGATMAYEFVSEAVTMAIMKLNVMKETPVVYGVLTCSSEDEAKACASSKGTCIQGHTGAKQCNHGVEWAQVAIELALLKRSTTEMIEKKCQCQCHCKQVGCSCTCHCRQCKCRVCSCGSACSCTSCFEHAPQQKSASDELATLSSKCTGCGHSAKECTCAHCHCGVCALKHLAHSAKAPAETASKSSTCTGCSKSSTDCKCRDCNCASCADKQERAQGELECGGCGHKKKLCSCKTSHTAHGVTTGTKHHGLTP